MKGLVLASVGVVSVMAATGAARAQHAGDIVLRVHEGRIETGSGVPSAGTFAPGRMFTMTLGAQGPPNFASNPGYDCEAGTFPAGTAVGFDVLDRLYFCLQCRTVFLFRADAQDHERDCGHAEISEFPFADAVV